MIDALNNQHAIASHIQFELGVGRLPTAYINNAHARATVSLHGGHMVSFANEHGQLLWVSGLATYDHGEAIRGGVPVIWPWFGAHLTDKDLPAHGFVRASMWDVVRTEVLADGGTRLVLGIEDSAETRAIWPHSFQLQVTFDIATTLTITLTVKNTGATPFRWSGALHTYFAISDVAQTAVAGLDGVAFKDTVAHVDDVQSGDIRFPDGATVDNVYHAAPAELLLQDETHVTRITSQNADATVVWNPGRSVQKADIDEDAFERFVCVETACGASATTQDEMPLLAPGESTTFSATYQHEERA